MTFTNATCPAYLQTHQPVVQNNNDFATMVSERLHDPLIQQRVSGVCFGVSCACAGASLYYFSKAGKAYYTAFKYAFLNEAQKSLPSKLADKYASRQTRAFMWQGLEHTRKTLIMGATATCAFVMPSILGIHSS